MASLAVMLLATTSLSSVLNPAKPSSGTMPLLTLETTLPPEMVRPAGTEPTVELAVPSSLKAPALTTAAISGYLSMTWFSRMPGLEVEKPEALEPL